MGVVHINNRSVHITPSASLELSHIISILGSEPRFTPPWRERLAAERPDLIRAAADLWPERAAGVPSGYELLFIVTATNNTALTDPGPLWEQFPQWLREAASQLAQAPRSNESAAVLEIVGRRLDDLRDENLQRRYTKLLHDLWDVLGPVWESEGLPVIQVECARFAQGLQNGAELVDILPAKSFLALEYYMGLLQEQADRNFVVTPLYFSRGGFLVDTGLPGLPVFLGYAIDTDGWQTAIHTKAAEVASRMKAFADPTRLTLLATISGIEVTVGDLAKLLGITQPTVSGHLRTLERAGLVKVRRKGVKAYYRADTDAVSGLLDEARRLLR
jgi:ArsR family transcriptional regulator